MEFSYKLTIWECIAGGAKRAFRFLVYKSKFFRTLMLILGGTAMLVSVPGAVSDGGVHVVPLLLPACSLLLLCVLIWLFLLPFEAARIYRQCGKRERTVRIEDGSIFVKDGGTVREYLCRNILEFQRKGRLYRIVMTWRIGTLMELYIPVRLVGEKEEQETFRRYVNDQRRISGDKLTVQAEEECGNCDEDEGGLCQNWSMDTVTEAMAEDYWIKTHYMKRAGRWDRIFQNEETFVRLACFCLIAVPVIYGTGMWGIVSILIVVAARKLLIRRPHTLSQQSICEALKSQGIDTFTYKERSKIYFTPQGIRRIAPMLDNTWSWSEVGYLFETDEYFYFYSREQSLLFYMEKGLLGDWMAQKLFIQDCQAKGISYQIVMPEFVRNTQPLKDGGNAPAGREVPGNRGLQVLDGGKASQKQEDVKKVRTAKKKDRHSVPDTQEGWRRFWAEREKEKSDPERLRVIVTVLAVIGIFLLAVFLPDFRGSQSIGGVPVIMDMPHNGEEYVFHPESYENYVPLADQVTVLESLGFEIPEEVVEEMNQGMEEMPMARAWVEGYPYASLLSAVGMPERDYEAWEITRYSDQAYWFDWEGFDMSMEYVYILNGLNAMSGGDFTITDAQQEMSDADWDKGTGTVLVRFHINGEQCEYKMKFMNDWLDSDIIRDLNDALDKAGIEKRVYAMADDGQGCILFYRDKEWAKRFRKETGIRLETR